MTIDMTIDMTVDKAVNKGLIFVNGPVVIIMFSLSGWLMYAAVVNIIPWYFLILGFLIGPCVAWIFWSFAITKWRIWAFRKVENHSELKQSAVIAGLIWEDGSFFEKTEIRTQKEQNLIDDLEKRYKGRKSTQKFRDDPDVGEVTTYNYSKISISINFILLVLSAGFGIYLIYQDNDLLTGIILICIGIFLGYKNIKKLSNSNSPLTIGNFGIEINSTQYSWHQISNTKIKLVGFGKNQTHNLQFEVSTGTVIINLIDFNLRISDLRHRLYIYKGRNNKH